MSTPFPTPDSSLALVTAYWLDRRADEVRQGDKKPNTLRNNQQALKRLGALGCKPLNAITCPDVLRWHEDLYSRLSSPLAYTAYVNVRNVCNWARRQGLIATNPAAALGLSYNAKRTTPLRPEQVRRWREALDQVERRKLEWLRPRRLSLRERFAYLSSVRALRLLESCGRRIREVTDLLTDHVSLESRCIALPDTKCGPSVVLLSKRSLGLVRQQLDEHGGCSPYLFPCPLNFDAPISYTTVWELHHEVCGIAKVRVRPHGLRHAWAFAALFGGANLRATGRVLGQKNPRTTERVYGGEVFVTPDMFEAVEIAEATKVRATPEVL